MTDKIFTPIKERVFKFIDLKRIKKEFFFKKIGLSASNFKGVGAKSELGGDKIVKILSEYTDLNAEWLLTGKGEMLKPIENHEVADISPIANKPSYNVSKDQQYIKSLEKNLDDLRKANLHQEANLLDLRNNLQDLRKAIDTKDAEMERLIATLEMQKKESLSFKAAHRDSKGEQEDEGKQAT